MNQTTWLSIGILLGASVGISMGIATGSFIIGFSTGIGSAISMGLAFVLVAKEENNNSGERRTGNGVMKLRPLALIGYSVNR